MPPWWPYFIRALAGSRNPDERSCHGHFLFFFPSHFSFFPLNSVYLSWAMSKECQWPAWLAQWGGRAGLFCFCGTLAHCVGNQSVELCQRNPLRSLSRYRGHPRTYANWSAKTATRRTEHVQRNVTGSCFVLHACQSLRSVQSRTWMFKERIQLLWVKQRHQNFLALFLDVYHIYCWIQTKEDIWKCHTVILDQIFRLMLFTHFIQSRREHVSFIHKKLWGSRGDVADMAAQIDFLNLTRL